MRYNKFIATMYLGLMLSMSIFAANFTEDAEFFPYSDSVEDINKTSLMTYTDDALWAPNDNVTVAEAITVCARIHGTYYGKTINNSQSQNGSDEYIAYAISNGIVSEGQFSDYSGDVKRYEFISMLEKSLPHSLFSQIKNVDKIHDVPVSFDYYDALLMLYNAGIITGSDSYGNFFPERTITRAETTAIVNRVASPDKRIRETLRKTTTDTAYLLADTRKYSGANTGTESGWLLDNRGGVPKTDDKATTGSLVDISETAGTALIKEFNKTTTGKIVHRININLTSNSEGAYISYRNDEDEEIFKLAVKDNYWSLLQSDGTYKKLVKAVASTFYRTVITIDLDNSLCSLYLNDYYSGEHPLIMENTNVINMRYGTDEEGKASFAVSDTEMFVNYGAYHSFRLDGDGKAPFGWNTDNAKVDAGLFKIGSAGSASTSFDPVSGIIVYEQQMFIDANTKASVLLKSEDSDVTKITVDSLNINVNGSNVYKTYSGGLWYRLRFELDTETMTVTAKVNGRKVGNVSFLTRATSVDRLLINNNSTTHTVSVDNIKIYEDVRFDDYVPAPVIPAGEEKYVVGINVCSLWKEGTHEGWASISPYERPLIGYYDEGNPESADWEIKYMAEHGIDFQAFCWYGEKSNDYLKDPSYSSQLHDGYMNAKYSDSMKYCLIWECSNSYLPSSMDAFKNYFVPYLIENYFKDPRYMTVENKPVFSLFGATRLAEASFLGSYSNVKLALDYLRNQVVALGYDGMIILGCGLSPSVATTLGLDGIHPYSFGTEGYSLQYNKERNYQLATAKPYNVPSISVGFNSVAWGQDRTPLMTTEDFKNGVLWVRDTYMPKFSTNSWNKNFTILSTWNEYGEGTYIMPCENNGGFGYLDGVREAFTDEKANEALNVVPTENQLKRITRLYPQYRRLLHDTNYSEFEYTMDKYETVVSYNFKTLLSSNSNHSSFTADANGIHGVAKNADPYFFLNSPGNITLDSIASVKINAKIPSGNIFQLFYTTQADTVVSEAKSMFITSQTNDWQEFTLTPTKSNWTGSLVSLRIDPVNTVSASYSIKTVSLLNKAGEVVYTYDCSKMYAPNVDISSQYFYSQGKDQTGVYGYTRTTSSFFTINTDIDLTDIDAIRLRARGGQGGTFALYFQPVNQSYSEDFAVSCITTSLVAEDHIIELKDTMTGVMKNVRIYPAFVQHQYFRLESIEFLKIKKPPVSVSHFNINGNEFDIKTNNEILPDGTVLSAFDPSVCLDYMLNAFHLWDKENGVLKLMFDEDELVYTVGSSSYYHNGTRKNLGYTLKLNDGLPMISLKQICNDIGYSYSLSANGTTVINTPQKAYFDEINNPTPGVWEFNTPGYTGGWITSGHHISVGAAGALIFHSTHTDPVMTYTFETPLVASSYNTLKIRMKHNTQKANNALRVYFTTDTSPGLSESKAFGCNLIGGKVSNGYVIYTIKIANADWKGKITSIRFDPFDDIGTAEIDYIKFLYQ